MLVKTATAQRPSRVSIAARVSADDDLGAWLEERASGEGWSTRFTKCYLMIEVTPPDAGRVELGRPVVDQIEAVRSLAGAARSLRDWWNALSGERAAR